MPNRKGKLYVISAPSGTGKSTVIARIMELRPEMTFSVSATTRQPRPGDEEGKTYYFKSKEEFEQMVRFGQLLEYAEFAGNYYGTPIEPIKEKIEKGIDTILDIEVKGFHQVKKLMPDAVSIFMMPPSLEVLEQRLRNRGTDSEETIAKRLRVASEEILQKNDYDYVVENDVVENAVNKILLIMASQDK